MKIKCVMGNKMATQTMELERECIWGEEYVCPRASQGCEGAKDFDEFKYRCSNELLASICPRDHKNLGDKLK